ncbi:MAG TPA: fused MFS/spermidine synthase [Paenalcaligenes sp.]|nr:fused MFS/spermidine synthase [Paenalcaligenes sp.]
MDHFIVQEEDSPGDITISEDGGVRYLHFGTRWIQGAMSLTRPNDLVLTYTQQMMGWMLFERPQGINKLAILGLGAGGLVRFCHEHVQQAHIDVIEIDPEVTAMCQAFFRLPKSKRIEIIHDDAEHWVNEPSQHDQYDLLLIDLYDEHARGPVCSSRSFYQGCANSLNKHGICVINLFGNHESFDTNMENIEAAFSGRYILLPEVDEGNVIAIAFKGTQLDVSVGELLERAGQLKKTYRFPALKWIKGLLSSLQTK